jgi:hypothetical protein
MKYGRFDQQGRVSSGVSKAIRWSNEILQKEIGVLRNPVTRAGA